MIMEIVAEETKATEPGFTPGRWFWNINLKAKQVSLQAEDGPRQYVIDFVRWGMNGAQPRFQIDGLMQDAQDCAVVVEGREHHAAWYQTINHPDARLIAAAPALYEALFNLAFSYDARDRGDGCWCRIENDETYFERKGEHDKWCLAARSAIALVDGNSQTEDK